MTTVTICGHQLPIVEYQGQRVVTLAMIDEVHERPEGTARRNFNEHRPRFIEAEDFFVRNSYEARQMGITAPNGLTLLTESGYLMLVKSLSDDLAWEVQRQLVRSYFRPAAPAFAVPQNLSEALRLAADLEDQKNQALLERDHAIATKAQIGSKREASAMATASAASRKARQLEQELGRGVMHATVIAVEKASGRKFGTQGFQPLKKWCKAHDVTPPKVPCPRYGKAVSWPADAWREVYGVDLGELFGGEVAA
ncbi:ORF6N domain-containing protein [Azotobacter vinelandii]|uniref:ORF6N domain-containing protein n=1 Tax=Azotobacter vinelandii TaxID=354 RepID=UPI002665C5B8|nr:ORF6N domain-containing protein [Azotobacter vinelandii]WKN20639.1 ORF6N domain-containing protein [Azotobacter vinelandii]